MNTSSLRIVNAWLLGQSDAGIDLNGGIALPLFLKPQLSALLQAAVLADESRPAGEDPFERAGVWHRAVNIVMAALSDECRAMTAHHEYPHGLGLGDGAFQSFMSAVRDFGLELPTAEALQAADAERAARAQAQRAAALAAQEAVRAQPVAAWDDANAFD